MHKAHKWVSVPSMFSKDRFRLMLLMKTIRSPRDDVRRGTTIQKPRRQSGIMYGVGGEEVGGGDGKE